MTIYDFTATDNKGNEVSLSKYKGKVVLIVNTATGCGFTPQYEGLEVLYQKYKEQGLVILDFPCNQFLGQAPGTDEEIESFCKLNYGTSFPRFKKIDVNGKNAHPLYVYLKEEAPQDIENKATPELKKVLQKMMQTFTKTAIKWNFTKFLINQQGEIVARLSPTVTPKELEPYIDKLIG